MWLYLTTIYIGATTVPAASCVGNGGAISSDGTEDIPNAGASSKPQSIFSKCKQNVQIEYIYNIHNYIPT